MKIEELKSFNDRNLDLIDARKKLENLGFKEVHDDKDSEGSFGLVFVHPKLNYVLKVFKLDDGYIEFYKLAIKNQDNPHFPKFKGKLIKINNNLFAVRMEKLQKLADFNIFSYISDEINDNSFKNRILKNENIIASIKEKYPKLVKACIGIYNILESKPYLTLDLHSENIMMRSDHTPVIIDPLYRRSQWRLR